LCRRVKIDVNLVVSVFQKVFVIAEGEFNIIQAFRRAWRRIEPYGFMLHPFSSYAPAG
jgi:hypothetical protein